MDNNEFNENNLGNGQGQDNNLYGFNPDLNHNNYNNNSNYNLHIIKKKPSFFG